MGLELRNLAKRYGPVEVLGPLSLQVASGEFLTLLGPSGSGKTTVLRIVGGFTDASAGQILFDGEDITDAPANRRPFNTVFQDYALFPHMTVERNVGYGPLVQGRHAKKLIDETIEVVGLGGLRDRYPAQLSGGQKQRVALARAIVCEPKVILLDEPLAALDANLRRQMQLFLKQTQRRINTTFLFVTHDQDEAIAMSDRIAVMNQGAIEQVGTPKEIYFQPRTKFVASFFGDNNLIEGAQAGPGMIDTSLGPLPAGTGSAIAKGRKILLAIRPESLRLAAGAVNIPARIEDVMFGGATTRLLLRTGSGMPLNVRLPGKDVHSVGDSVSVSYDPADAVVIEV